MNALFDSLAVGNKLEGVERAVLRKVMRWRDARRPGKTEEDLATWFVTGESSNIKIQGKVHELLPRHQRRQTVLDFLESQEKEGRHNGGASRLYHMLSSRHVFDRVSYCKRNCIPLAKKKES